MDAQMTGDDLDIRPFTLSQRDREFLALIEECQRLMWPQFYPPLPSELLGPGPLTTTKRYR